MSDKTFEKNRKLNVWASAEVAFFSSLIQGKQVLGLMDGKRLRVGDIFKTLVGPMRENGFIRDASQLIIQYKDLKAEYYKARRHNNISGNNSYIFEFYNEMNQILGNRPLSQASDGNTQIGFDSIADIPVLDENDPSQLNVVNLQMEFYDDAPDADGEIAGCSKDEGIRKLSDCAASLARTQNTTTTVGYLANTEITKNSIATTSSENTPRNMYKRRKVKQYPSELEEFLKRSEENRKKELEAEKEMMNTFLEQQQ